MLTDQERLRIWSCTDADGMSTPHVDTDRYATPFGLLATSVRNDTLIWLVQNVGSGSGAFIRSHEIGDLLYYYTGANLTDAQVQEALLLLGIEPWDTVPEDWVYRVHKDCPCSSMALDGEGGIKTVDRSLYCALQSESRV